MKTQSQSITLWLSSCKQAIGKQDLSWSVKIQAHCRERLSLISIRLTNIFPIMPLRYASLNLLDPLAYHALILRHHYAANRYDRDKLGQYHQSRIVH